MTARSLAKVPLFASLDRAGRAAIAERCRWVDASPGELIVAHGDPTRDVFFITSGRVAIARTSRNGRTVALGEIDAGGVFGELAALDGLARSASIVATHRSVIARLPPEAFASVLAEHPDVAHAVLLRLAAEVRRLAQNVDELSTLTVGGRLVAELLRLAKPADDDTLIVSPPPRHADLAARIGSHREAITKELAKLEQEHFLRRDGKRFVLRNVAMLRTMVSEASFS